MDLGEKKSDFSIEYLCGSGFTWLPMTSPQESNRKIRCWVFTINNPSEDNLPEKLKANNAVYCVWQKERGDNNTPHLQGYVIFKSPRKFSSVRLYLACNPHWEPRRGSHSQAKEYCIKEDTRIAGPWSFGEEPSGQGRRNDLVSLKRALDDGLSEREICDDDDLFPVWCRYFKSVERYKRLHTTRRS